MNQDGQHGSRSAPVDEVTSNRAEANQDSQRSPGSASANGTVYPIASNSAEVNPGSAAVDDPRSTGTSKKRERKGRSDSPVASNSAELEANQDGEHGPGSAPADENMCSAASSPGSTSADGTVYPIASKSAEVNPGSATVDDHRSTSTSKKRKRKRRSESPAASHSADLEADRDGEHGPGSAPADENVCFAASNSAEVNQDRRLGSGSVPVDKNTRGTSEKRRRKANNNVNQDSGSVGSGSAPVDENADGTSEKRKRNDNANSGGDEMTGNEGKQLL